MRLSLFIILMMVCLSACGPAEIIPPDSGNSSLQLVTPAVPSGAAFLDACTHMLSYPETIPPLDTTGLLFFAEANPDIFVTIEPRRRTTAEVGQTLEQISVSIRESADFETEIQPFASLSVKNYLGEDLPGLIGDYINSRGHRVRLLVVIQPNSVLMDSLSDDVVYIITAQTPQNQWNQWVDQLDIFFQTFHPVMCGGV